VSNKGLLVIFMLLLRVLLLRERAFELSSPFEQLLPITLVCDLLLSFPLVFRVGPVIVATLFASLCPPLGPLQRIARSESDLLSSLDGEGGVILSLSGVARSEG